MNILQGYFSEHLGEPGQAVAGDTVTRMEPGATRLVLVKVGQLRFALPSTDIAALTRTPEHDCDYVSATALVPPRYHAAIAADGSGDTFVHLAGSRLGFGPCRSDGEIHATQDVLRPRSTLGDEPWIVATLATPPSLVVDARALRERLHAASAA